VFSVIGIVFLLFFRLIGFLLFLLHSTWRTSHLLFFLFDWSRAGLGLGLCR
jgi:hypothetical protein